MHPKLPTDDGKQNSQGSFKLKYFKCIRLPTALINFSSKTSPSRFNTLNNLKSLKSNSLSIQWTTFGWQLNVRKDRRWVSFSIFKLTYLLACSSLFLKTDVASARHSTGTPWSKFMARLRTFFRVVAVTRGWNGFLLQKIGNLKKSFFSCF